MIASTGFINPSGIAVDSNGTIYVSDSSNTIKRFTQAFVNTTSISEPVSAGTDQLLPIYPLTSLLNAVSDQPWLTITSQKNGIVSFGFTSTTSTRIAHITVLGQSIAITQSASASAGQVYVPVTPCRVVDTRNPGSAFGGPEMSGGSTRDFPIPSGECGIPLTAQAYALNVTVVPDAELGYLAIWPEGLSQPLVSTLNSDGRVKAASAIVPAGTSGGVSVYVSDATQVILDVVGYFVPQISSPSGLAFDPLAPCRISDTRNPAGPFGGPYFASGQSRAVPLLSSACSVPATAQAYSLNLTAVPHTDLGYLSAWPDGQPQPLASNLNASTGSVTANAAIVPAGTDGNIRIYTSDDTDVIVDINGYFAPQSAGGLALYTVTPCRFLDTRSNIGQPWSGEMAVNVAETSCGIRAGAQAYVLNATVVPPGILGYLSLWPDGDAQPLVSTLNADAGAVTSNMAIVPASIGFIDAYASQPAQLILDISSYFAP